MKQTLSKSSILLTTALVSASSMAFAEGHDAEQLAASQLTQAASMSGTTSFGAYTIAPSWSEELGFSLNGAIGYTLDEKSALGLVVTGGEKLREALLNFGFTIDAERQIVLSAGQLQEKLTFGEGEAEWVKQNEFGIAYDATNYSLNIFHVDSETTDNFVGAKSTGVEMEGTVALSSLASLDYGVGYEKLEWDDGSVGEEGVTGRLSFDVQANDTTVVNVFADHNLSENQYGLGATWALGAGSLTASYTYIDGLVGAIEDDQRVSVAFNMPLGAATPVTTSVSSSGIAAARANNLLADVMKRPDFLPQRVIAKDAGQQCQSLISIDGKVGAGDSWYIETTSSSPTWNFVPAITSSSIASAILQVNGGASINLLSAGDLDSIDGTTINLDGVEYWGEGSSLYIKVVLNSGECFEGSDDSADATPPLPVYFVYNDGTPPDGFDVTPNCPEGSIEVAASENYGRTAMNSPGDNDFPNQALDTAKAYGHRYTGAYPGFLNNATVYSDGAWSAINETSLPYGGMICYGTFTASPT